MLCVLRKNSHVFKTGPGWYAARSALSRVRAVHGRDLLISATLSCPWHPRLRSGSRGESGMESRVRLSPEVTLISSILVLVTVRSHMAHLHLGGWGLAPFLFWTRFSIKAELIGCIHIIKRDSYRKPTDGFPHSREAENSVAAQLTRLTVSAVRSVTGTHLSWKAKEVRI